MSDMTVTVTGLDQFAAAVRRIDQQLPAAVGASLYRDMYEVMAKSQQLAPVLTGALRDSGDVDRPEVNGRDVSVSLHYGSPTVDYALIQHETGRKRKFLQDPLEEWTGDGPERVVRRAVEGLGR